MTCSSKESAAKEVKAVRELFPVAQGKLNDLNELLEKHDMWRALRVDREVCEERASQMQETRRGSPHY